jgi:hypothetical protein
MFTNEFNLSKQEDQAEIISALAQVSTDELKAFVLLQLGQRA